jgi:chemotaxis protein MotB
MAPKAQQQMEQLQQKLLHLLKNSPTARDVKIFETEQGMVIRFRDLIFFDTGKATLRPEVKPLLDQIAHLLEKIPNKIMVEGHTDNRPIHTKKYPSNWELSTARATSLVRYLIEHCHLEPGQLSAAGYGEYHPVADNRDEAGQQANRRVDIIIRSLRS